MRVALSSGAESVSVGVREPHFIKMNLNALRFEPLSKDELLHLLKGLKEYKTQ